ncbi:EamA family transporter [Salinicoccus halitifaciens]|uniref:DME family drug/metabolite transporter n=1 Tax=Salinicoccus halitifaciens TaxID=1073415 RepID=A0ABV2EBL8_9STAP|nr:EamA family transporter [Salinicoccus halitifaciens]MCD2137640.1 EamA family transporter [Salinicoccus halitifaciens]
MRQSLAPYMILFAAMLWGTAGTAKAFASDVDSISMGAVRLAVGGLLLMLIAVLTRRITFRGWPVKPLLIGGLAMALFQPFFFSAVELTGIAVGTVVSIGSAPVFSGLIEWLIFKIRPARVWWLSTILAITGCIILMFNTNDVTVNPLGILAGLGAGISFASFTMSNSRLVRTHDPIASVAMIFCLSAVILSPFFFINDMSWLGETNGLLVALHIGVLATALAYFLFSNGLKFVKSSTAVTLSLAEPLTASLLGVFLVGESLDALSWVGLLMLLAGIVILVLQSRRNRREAPVNA